MLNTGQKRGCFCNAHNLYVFVTKPIKPLLKTVRLLFFRLFWPFTLVTILTLPSCDKNRSDNQRSTFAKINAEKTLSIGYVVFPPCVWKNPKTGEIEGHFAATVQEIARQSGWKLEFQEADWATFAAGLNAKRFDLSIAPTFVTIPRAAAVSFTRPLFYAGNSAIVRKNESRFSDIRSLDQPGVKIAVTQGEAGHEYAKANLTKAQLIVHPGADQTLTFQDVLSGRTDVGLGDAYVTAKFAVEHADSVKDLFAGHPYNLTPVSWAVRHQDADLLNFVNSCIEAMESQGKLREFERAAGAHWLRPKREWETQ